VRQWAENQRDAFNDIRNSPDPRLRQYYKDLHQTRQQHAQETWEIKKSDELKADLSGQKATVNECHNGELSTVSIGSYQFTISRKLDLKVKDGDEVFIQFELTETPHPHVYARKARVDDPASRFAISLTGHNTSGDFFGWLTTSGELNVKKMNSLVDVLEGCSREECLTFKRRWYVKCTIPGDRSSRDHMYT
jgi:hypothetical protein